MFKLAFALALLSSSVFAQERVLDPQRVTGTDGIISQCVSFTREAFANQMCDVAIKELSSVMDQLGIPHRHLGRTEWGFGVDRYLVPKGDPGMAQPLHLTFYIRGTDAPPAASLWASLYRDLGKDGRLVVWEDHGIGAGNATDVTSGLGLGLAAKVGTVLQVVASAR